MRSGYSSEENGRKNTWAYQGYQTLKDGVIADFISLRNVVLFYQSAQKKTVTLSPRSCLCSYGATQVEDGYQRVSANAGGREVYLIDEPMAAALGANLPVSP